MNSIYKIILIFTFIAALNIFAPAQTEREKGIEFYNKGNYAEAIRYFDRVRQDKAYKKDAEIWNYLGLAYTNQKREKDARKAFEKAVKYAPQNSKYRANLAYAWLLNRKTNKAQSEIQKAIRLDPKNANAYYIRGTANLWEGKNERAATDAQQAIALDPQLTAAYVLHSDSLMGTFGEKWGESRAPRENINLLENAAQTLNKCLADCPKDNTLKTVTERADAVNAFLEYFKRKDSPPDSSTAQNITPLNITFKPKPKYTDEARQKNEKGNIRIAMMFSADGKTKYALVLQGLRYGLNEQAMIAARGIGFEPEKIDGKPVSVVKVVVFTFSIY